MGRKWPWIGVLAAGILTLGLAWKWVEARNPKPNPMLVLVDPEVEEGSGMGLAHRLALGNLTQDFLEGAAQVPLFRLPYAPGAEILAPTADGQTLVLRLKALRRGENLQWVLRWISIHDLKAGQAYKELQGPILPPREAFAWMLSELPLRVKKEVLPSLLPASPEAFWEFVKASALGSEGPQQDESIRRLEGLCQSFPGIATFRAQLGIQLYFRMNGRSEHPAEDQTRAKAALEECLRLLPYLGRAVAFLSRLKTDAGSVRDALELLRDARKHRPNDISILAALSYPSRYAGLLSLAVNAADATTARSPIRTRPGRLAFHLLYLGRWDEFQASLWEWPADPRNATCRFHRGHLALLRGDREGALALMRETEQMPDSYGLNVTLAHVHRLILEGRSAEAGKILQEVHRQRAGMRVTDGEITFSLAEAYAALGDVPQAMELLRAAFSQGFGCTRWYEVNPSLAAVRNLPEWSWLQQHLKERQALYERRFPTDSFGL